MAVTSAVCSSREDNAFDAVLGRFMGLSKKLDEALMGATGTSFRAAIATNLSSPAFNISYAARQDLKAGEQVDDDLTAATAGAAEQPPRAAINPRMRIARAMWNISKAWKREKGSTPTLLALASVHAAQEVSVSAASSPTWASHPRLSPAEPVTILCPCSTLADPSQSPKANRDDPRGRTAANSQRVAGWPCAGVPQTDL